MNVFLLEYEVESFFKYSRVLTPEGLGLDLPYNTVRNVCARCQNQSGFVEEGCGLLFENTVRVYCICNKFTTLRVTLVSLVLVRQYKSFPLAQTFWPVLYSSRALVELSDWTVSTVGTWTADDNKTIGRIVKPSAVTGVSRGHWPVTQLFSGLAGWLFSLRSLHYNTPHSCAV